MSSNSADRLSKPVDIHLYVVRAGDVLKLTMVSAHLGFPALEGVSARFPRDPENLANRFFSAAESLDRGEGAGTRLISEEPVTELRDRSRDLYRQIFPRNFRSRLDDPELSGCSLVIETNEPWIPWEMLHTDGRDGDFLCLRFNLARWLRGQVEPPPSVLEISRILCVDAGNLRDSDTSELPGVAKEIEAIKRFSDRVPGILCSEVERPPVFASTQGAIARTCANVLHLSGHGGLDENAAFLVLADRRLYPWNLTPSQHPDLLTALCETRPLIFLNACRNGRRQEGFVGFAGWPDTLIKANACGGFIAPALPVRDRCATAFAVDFYRALEAGHFLGEAVRQARIQAVSSSNRASGTQKSRLIEILSYSFYGHPNAKIRLGSERRSVASESVGSINQATQASRVFLSSRSHSHAILERITESLEAAGSEVSAGSWRLPGVSWSEALTQRLVATDVLVVLVSPPGLSNWQLREIQAVTSERTIFSPRVVVVLLPGGKPPLNLLRFSDWVDLRTDPYDSRRLAMLVSLVVRSRKNIGETKCGTEERVKVCPYRGLLAFREEDAVAYFGRTRDIERLETALERHRIITIYGASGSGKSSLVRAGLSSRLRRATDSAWEIIAFQPGEDPIEALALACWPFLESEDSTRDEVYREGWIERFCQGLREDPSRFANYGRRILEKQIGTDRLLMIVDQAEDLFTKVDEETRRVFSEALISASRGPSLWALLTLRGKFLEEALEDPSLGTCVEQSSLALRSIDRSALIEIIERPAELGEVAIDPHLAKRIIADVDKEPGSLPILEFALTELWNASGGVGLRTIDYDGFGGVKHVIANRAETLYSELSGAEANALRILFLELVSPGETVDTRRQVRSDEIPEIAQAVVDRLVDARLLTTSSTGDESAEGTVEVAHEALITHWDRLQDWIEADREFLLWRERLRRASDRWIRDDRRKRALWEKGDLIEGERWMAERPDLGNDEFLVQSLAARSRKQWIDRSATLLIVFLALAAGVFGVRSLYEAEQVRVQARTIRSQALLTNAANHPDPSIGARVLANLGTQDPLGQSIHALDIGHKIVKQFGAERRIFFDGGEGIISDDASRLALAYADGRILVWETQHLELIAQLEGHRAEIELLAFNSDGRRVASASADGTLRVWDVDSSSLLKIVDVSMYPPSVLQLSDDGSSFVFGSSNHIVGVGRTDAILPPLKLLRGHEGPIESIDISPGGSFLVTTATDRTVRMWSLNGGGQIVTRKSNLRGAIFLGDEESIAINSAFGIEVWKRGHVGGPVARLPTATYRAVTTMKFDRKRMKILTGSRAGELRSWDWHESAKSVKIAGRMKKITSIDMSSDGRFMLVGASDGTLWIHQLSSLRTAPVELRGHTQSILAARFVNEGKYVLSVSKDGSARLWNTRQLKRQEITGLGLFRTRGEPALLAWVDPFVALTADESGGL